MHLCTCWISTDDGIFTICFALLRKSLFPLLKTVLWLCYNMMFFNLWGKNESNFIYEQVISSFGQSFYWFKLKSMINLTLRTKLSLVITHIPTPIKMHTCIVWVFLPLLIFSPKSMSETNIYIGHECSMYRVYHISMG